MPSFEEFLAEFLEEPAEVMAALSDVVSKGRLQAGALESETLEALGKYELVMVLIQRNPGRPVRTWIYPSPMGLRLFSFLEREAEREEERQRAEKAAARTKPRDRGRRYKA